MSDILKKKIDDLKQSKDYSNWYFVKQFASFPSLCYQVQILKQYQDNNETTDFQEYFKKNVSNISVNHPDLDISKTYRALQNAAYFGLIIKKGNKYTNSKISDTYYEIQKNCDGRFEKTELYSNIIQRQIEKMFISSDLDEKKDSIRAEFRLYPTMLLYKILLELGRSTGKYEISMNEFNFLVSTTKRFQDFLDTLVFIKLLRADPVENSKLREEFKQKFDGRINKALDQLPSLNFTSKKINLNLNFIDEVDEKVFIFEKNPDIFNTSQYFEFLGSSKSLLQLKEFEDNQAQLNNFKEPDRIRNGNNFLLYGVPGSGKSYTIQKEYISEGSITDRIVFYPDYSYTDFVGQIMPVVTESNLEESQVTYDFTPGPFTRILKSAVMNPTVEHNLIIEEINRGNAAAIFGEIFQLLDRNQGVDKKFPLGTSQYSISNTDISKFVFGNQHSEIRIPSNLNIIATMNTSDQNVFTLDTAFQRRWKMRLIENSFSEGDKYLKDFIILDTDLTWGKFCIAINEIILEDNAMLSSTEDKRLGIHFVDISELEANNQDDSEFRLFPEKVIKYLWDDAFKFSREKIFDTSNFNSLEKVIRKFVEAKGSDRFNVFNDATLSRLYPKESGDIMRDGGGLIDQEN